MHLRWSSVLTAHLLRKLAENLMSKHISDSFFPLYFQHVKFSIFSLEPLGLTRKIAALWAALF